MKKLVVALVSLATFNAFAADANALGHFDMELGAQLVAYDQSCGNAADALTRSEMRDDANVQRVVRFLRRYPSFVRASLISSTGNVMGFACLKPNGPVVEAQYSDGSVMYYQKRNFVLDKQ